MKSRPLLPLADYQRIYQVIYSVLEATGAARTHRSCIFFASVGTTIMRERYSLPATISAGCMALMVDERAPNVVVYGREEEGAFVNDHQAFHAWVECNGWLIDFMAPIMGTALREDGRDWSIPARMLQKPLDAGKESLSALARNGDFFFQHDSQLLESLIDQQGSSFDDLVNVCLKWFRRPPKPLPPIALADNQGMRKPLVARAPVIVGVW